MYIFVFLRVHWSVHSDDYYETLRIAIDGVKSVFALQSNIDNDLLEF